MANFDDYESNGLDREDEDILRENVAAQLIEIDVVARKLKEHIGEDVPRAKLYEMAISLQHCLLLTDLLEGIE